MSFFDEKATTSDHPASDTSGSATRRPISTSARPPIYAAVRHASSRRRFKWLRPDLFVARQLAKDLPSDDAEPLEGPRRQCGEWDPDQDAKLDRPRTSLLTQDASEREGHRLHPVRRHGALPRRPAPSAAASTNAAGVTGEDRGPDRLSPGVSAPTATTSGHRSYRGRTPRPRRHRRAQRRPEPPGLRHRRQLRPALGHHPPHPAGRPRGPHRPEIRARFSATRSCPADGVERIIRLPRRVRQRLQENAEVVGTDEAFFEDDHERPEVILDLFTEKRPASSTATPTPRWTWPPTPTRSGRTPSTAIQTSQKTIPDLPHVVVLHQAATSALAPKHASPGRARLSPHRRGQRRPGLGGHGRPQASPSRSSRFSRPPSARRTPRRCRASATTTTWSARASRSVVRQEKIRRRQLRPPVRRPLPHLRTAQALRRAGQGHAVRHRRNSDKAIEDIYRYPLRQTATDTLNRQLRSGIDDQARRAGHRPARGRPPLSCRRGRRIRRTADHLLAGLSPGGRGR